MVSRKAEQGPNKGQASVRRVFGSFLETLQHTPGTCSEQGPGECSEQVPGDCSGGTCSAPVRFNKRLARVGSGSAGAIGGTPAIVSTLQEGRAFGPMS